MTMTTDTRAAVTLPLERWRAIAGIAAATGDTDTARTQLATLAIEVAGSTVTAWASDSYILAAYRETWTDTANVPGVIGADIAAFGKAVAAITKLAGGPKKGAAVPVTITGDDTGATLTAGGDSVTVPVPGRAPGAQYAPTATEWADTLGRLLAPYRIDGAKWHAPIGGQAFGPDILARIGAAGAAVGAIAWQHVGNGDTNPNRAPALYRAAFDRATPYDVELLAMPVRVPAV
jgi:hypothetical protein